MSAIAWAAPPKRPLTPKFETEADMLAVVVEWLRADGWQVYQEVQGFYGRADIVAVRGPMLWVIEGKMSFSLALLEQAYKWQGMANLVSVCVPKPKSAYGVGLRVPIRLGVGVLIVQPPSTYSSGWVTESWRGEFCRKIGDGIRNCLHPDQMIHGVAGSKGDFDTPFRRTCRNLAKLVAREPGITLQDALDRVDHHYTQDKSARRCLSALGLQGVIEAVRFEREGKAIRLWPNTTKGDR